VYDAILYKAGYYGWPLLFPPAEGKDETSSILQREAQALREALNVGARRNIAIARYEIDGQSGQLSAVSGRAARPGTVGIPQNPMFNPSYGTIYRPYDAEYKLLEALAAQTRPGASGTIDLYSGLPTCDACTSVIQQFEKAFPGISINVTTGG
jgi:filamentous hemagglutinin